MSGPAGIKISIELNAPQGGGAGKGAMPGPKRRKKRSNVRRPGGQLPVFDYARAGGLAQPARSQYYGSSSGNQNE